MTICQQGLGLGCFFPMLKIEILYYGRLDEYEYVRTCEEVVAWVRSLVACMMAAVRLTINCIACDVEISCDENKLQTQPRHHDDMFYITVPASIKPPVQHWVRMMLACRSQPATHGSMIPILSRSSRIYPNISPIYMTLYSIIRPNPK
jgi:hypothetical protein